MIDNRVLAAVRWRKSSFSGSGGTGGGNCVEIAPLPDGTIAVRHSRSADGPILVFTRREIDAWIKGCKAGEFDDLA